MGGSPRAIKPGKPVYWDWEPLSLRAMSPRYRRGLTVCIIYLFFIKLNNQFEIQEPFNKSSEI